MKQHIEISWQRQHYNKCGKSFQYDYTYNAWKPGVKEQIEKQTLNSCGIRDISRNFDFSKDTAISELRKKDRQKLICTS